MVTRVLQIDNLHDLRDYVNQTLCESFELQTDAFQMTQRVLRRGGKPCGMYFCLHGPRAVKFIAIWETDRNCILFYGPGGERFMKTQLLEAPELASSEPPVLERMAA